MQMLVADDPAADLALVVAPAAGRFRALAARSTVLASGGVLGHVTGAGRPAEACSPADAVVDGLLVLSGEPVQAGQVLAWGRRCRLESLA